MRPEEHQRSSLEVTIRSKSVDFSFFSGTGNTPLEVNETGCDGLDGTEDCM